MGEKVRKGILILTGDLHNMVIWKVVVSEDPTTVSCMKAEYLL